MDTFPNTAENGGAEYVLTKKDKCVFTILNKCVLCAMTIVLLKIQSDQNSSETSIYPGGKPSSNRLEAKYDQNYKQSRLKISEIHCCLKFEPELNSLDEKVVHLETHWQTVDIKRHQMTISILR